MSNRLCIVRFFVVAAAVVLLGCAGAGGPADPGNQDSIPPITAADTIPPQQVEGLTVIWSPPSNRLTIEWTAPWDNEPDLPVKRYEIRYTYTRGFTPPNFWQQSTIVFDPPLPGDPGKTERYLLGNASRGQDFYVGVRAYDGEENASPASDLSTIHVPGLTFRGQVINGLTKTPVPGLAVRLTAGVVRDVVTDANGQFTQDDILPGAVNIRIRQGTATTLFHELTQVFVMGADLSHNFVMVPYLPTTMPASGGISALSLQKVMTNKHGASPVILAKWHKVPVPVYIPAFVNGDGVNYKLQAERAAQRWNTRVGQTFFTFVDAPPDTGVILHYKPKADMGILVAVTRPTTGADLHPIRDDIDITNDLSTDNIAYRVMLHEFGHTFRFTHLNDSSYIMYGGQPIPQDISDDEVLAALIHLSLPTRVDMAIYDESIPPATR